MIEQDRAPSAEALKAANVFFDLTDGKVFGVEHLALAIDAARSASFDAGVAAAIQALREHPECLILAIAGTVPRDYSRDRAQRALTAIADWLASAAVPARP